MTPSKGVFPSKQEMPWLSLNSSSPGWVEGRACLWDHISKWSSEVQWTLLRVWGVDQVLAWCNSCCSTLRLGSTLLGQRMWQTTLGRLLGTVRPLLHCLLRCLCETLSGLRRQMWFYLSCQSFLSSLSAPRPILAGSVCSKVPGQGGEGGCWLPLSSSQINVHDCLSEDFLILCCPLEPFWYEPKGRILLPFQLSGFWFLP